MATTRPRCADALARHLAPAAGRGAEIDHARAGLEQMMLVVDLGELEGGARAEALALGPRHIGIVELALEPAACDDCDLRLLLTRTLSSRSPRRACRRRHDAASASPHTPSSRIICTSMPSRRPRSATRSRSHGKRAADRFQNGAAGEHQVGALGADAGIGDAALVAHGEQPLDHAGDLAVAHPAAVDAAALVARQIEIDAGDGGHRARGAEHVQAFGAAVLGGEAIDVGRDLRDHRARTPRGSPSRRRGARPASRRRSGSRSRPRSPDAAGRGGSAASGRAAPVRRSRRRCRTG